MLLSCTDKKWIPVDVRIRLSFSDPFTYKFKQVVYKTEHKNTTKYYQQYSITRLIKNSIACYDFRLFHTFKYVILLQYILQYNIIA